ncbi:MAG: PEP-CTERM sorting domain-containing protein [Isosphaeraceae bacterium]|nr:PEP-CTERM sorting domain-containing protein [Isosphaeraceae bacterium]
MLRIGTQPAIATACAALGLLLVGSAPARGGIVIDDATVEEISDPTFRYTFQVSLTEGCTIQSGDFFTIYDVFLPSESLSGHAEPVNWAFSSPALGPTPFSLNPPDSASILNLSWLYTGPTLSGPQLVGFFTATIVQPEAVTRSLVYASQCSVTGDIFQGTITPRFVPEPSSLVALACGASLVLLGAHRRRARTARAALSPSQVGASG